MSVFEVAISRTGPSDGKFRVEVVRSPAGEALAVVELNATELAVRREPVQQALLASSSRTRRMIAATEQVVQQIGQELFTALLGTGEVASQYRSAAAVAAESGYGSGCPASSPTSPAAKTCWPSWTRR